MGSENKNQPVANQDAKAKTANTQKPITNDTPTSKPTDSKSEAKPIASTNTTPISESSKTTSLPKTETEPSVSVINNPVLDRKTTAEVAEEGVKNLDAQLKSLQEKFTLQNEKNEALNVKNEALNVKTEQAPKSQLDSEVKIPSQGRAVIFHYDSTDGISTNRRTNSLPATVVLGDDLTVSLTVFTLDSRDPVVLRKDIPHRSIAPVNQYGIQNLPYWTWPEIK